MQRTLLSGGEVIAFDGSRHTHISNADVVFCDDKIEYVGPKYTIKPEQPVHETIDTTGYLVMPGLVNMHLHVTDTAFTRGWLDNYPAGTGTQAATNVTALYRLLPAIRGATKAEDQLAAAECAFAELLLSGSTTVVELSFDAEMGDGGNIATVNGTAKIAGDIGLRCYVGPRYRNSYWRLGNDNSPAYFDYENPARRMRDCFDFCAEIDGAYGGRLRGMLAPGQVDTCSAETLRSTRQYADQTGFPIQIHAGQSPSEFRRIASLHNRTTIEFLDDVGLLGPDLIIGHGMYLSESGDVADCNTNELTRLRDSGTHIAHLPWVKARQGVMMRSLAKYLNRGVNMCLGTDTYPFDMFSEMKIATAMCRVADQLPAAIAVEDVFHAATVGGALALNRNDLGRLAPGCQADIVLLDILKPHATPMLNPIQHIVLSARADDVDTVIIAGKKVVVNRQLTNCDLPASLRRLTDANKRVSDRLKLA
ncbi:MAG: amidohydrolase family protein [Pusillimonas sp.]